MWASALRHTFVKQGNDVELRLLVAWFEEQGQDMVFMDPSTRRAGSLIYRGKSVEIALEFEAKNLICITIGDDVLATLFKRTFVR